MSGQSWSSAPSRSHAGASQWAPLSTHLWGLGHVPKAQVSKPIYPPEALMLEHPSFRGLFIAGEGGWTGSCPPAQPSGSRGGSPGKQPEVAAVSPAAEPLTRETWLSENSDCSILCCLPETTQQYQICSKGMLKSSGSQQCTDHWPILKDKHTEFFASPHTNTPSKRTTALKHENQVHRGHHSEESHSPSDFLEHLVENTALNIDKRTARKITSARPGQNFVFHESSPFFLSLLSDTCDSSLLDILPPCNSSCNLHLLIK